MANDFRNDNINERGIHNLRYNDTVHGTITEVKGYEHRLHQNEDTRARFDCKVKLEDDDTTINVCLDERMSTKVYRGEIKLIPKYVIEITRFSAWGRTNGTGALTAFEMNTSPPLYFFEDNPVQIEERIDNHVQLDIDLEDGFDTDE